MKILMMTPRPPQANGAGGPGIVIHAQLLGLAARHEVTLLTLAGPDADHREALAQLRAAGIETHAVWRTQPAGLQLWRRRVWLAGAWLGTRYPWLAVLNWDRRAQALLDRLLAERPFDLLHVSDKAELGIYRYRLGIPRLLTDHEVRHPRPVAWGGRRDANPLAWALGEADWRRWRGYQQATWRKFDRVEVFTPYDAQAIRALAPDMAGRVRVNPFGIEIPPPADPAHEEPNTLVFTGSFGHAPNVEAALWLGHDIMPRLRAQRPGVRLMLVGGMPPPAVQALAASDVIVTGRVPQVEPYLERAAVVLAPVRSGGGQRTKVLQGMALGKAVVTTPLGAQGLELAGDPPPVRIAATAAEIVEAMIRLLESPENRAALGRQARAAVEAEYSPAAYARRIEAIYAELCPEGGRGALAPRPQPELRLVEVG
jgi:glycosyltransferase involved in cell wall biosynthesis